MQDLHPLNRFVRRLFAWPFALIGIILVSSGGGLLLVSSWILDIDTSEILKN
jgi:hypothetical protein